MDFTGREKQNVLFLGGSSFENAAAMDVASVSIVYNSAKDLCKLKSHGILLRNSLQLIASVLEFLYSSQTKCTILWMCVLQTTHSDLRQM